MANPVTYAEDTLGVHAVWEEAQERLSQHERAQHTFLGALTDIRSTETLLADREAELVAEQRGLHPTMKITEFREHLKVFRAQDEAMKKLHDRLDTYKGVRDVAEQEMRHAELGVRACTARMTELGGLLDFYAAAKRSAPAPT